MLVSFSNSEVMWTSCYSWTLTIGKIIVTFISFNKLWLGMPKQCVMSWFHLTMVMWSKFDFIIIQTLIKVIIIFTFIPFRKLPWTCLSNVWCEANWLGLNHCQMLLPNWLLQQYVSGHARAPCHALFSCIVAIIWFNLRKTLYWEFQ